MKGNFFQQPTSQLNSKTNVAKSQTVQFKPQAKSLHGSPETRKTQAGKKASLIPLGQSVLGDRSTSRPPEEGGNLYSDETAAMKDYNHSNIPLVQASNKTFYNYQSRHSKQQLKKVNITFSNNQQILASQ